MPSPEFLALASLNKPEQSKPGDMWLCRRLGIVKVINAHKRGTRRGERFNDFHLYHWGKPAMWSRPAQWRDNDPNGSAEDPARDRCMGTERWEYLGNMFDLLTYEALAGNPYSRESSNRAQEAP